MLRWFRQRLRFATAMAALVTLMRSLWCVGRDDDDDDDDRGADLTMTFWGDSKANGHVDGGRNYEVWCGSRESKLKGDKNTTASEICKQQQQQQGVKECFCQKCKKQRDKLK